MFQNSNENTVGNSTFSWNIINTENIEGTNYKAYYINFKVINMDEDISLWNVSFDEINGFITSMSERTDASRIALENGKIIIYGKDENAFVSKGSILNFVVKLVLDNNEDIDITNLALNGKLAKFNK